LNPLFEYIRDIILIICTIILTYKSIASNKKKKRKSSIQSKLVSFKFLLNIICVWLICIGIINPFKNSPTSFVMILIGLAGYSYIFISEKLYEQKVEFIFYTVFSLISIIYILLLIAENILIDIK
jgi:hypothetical protein